MPTAIVCLIAGHSVAFAQITKEQLHEYALAGDTSKFSVPVTIVDDHPQCSGPGFLAFSIELEANDLDFRVRGEQWDGTVRQLNRYDALTETDTCIIGEKPFDFDLQSEERCDDNQGRQQIVRKDNPFPSCYVTQRRGTEVSTVEMECANSADADSSGTLNELIRDADIDIDISVTAEICQSLTGIGLLSSEWTVAVETGGKTEMFTGAFGSERQLSPTEDNPLLLRLAYDRESYSLRTISDELANGPFQFDPMRSGSFMVSLQIDPLLLPNANELPFKLDAYRSYRVNAQ